jgi:hypothetical protein
LPNDKHQKLYGYHFEKITYPFKNVSVEMAGPLERELQLPAELIAEYNHNKDFKCKTRISFNSSDENLYRKSVHFVL